MKIQNPSVCIITLGCKVNQYESQAISEEFERNGFAITKNLPEAAVCVINTCTVTAESDRKARQVIRRVIAQNPSAFVVAMGCYTQHASDIILEIDGVDLVLGNTDKISAVQHAIAALDSSHTRQNAVTSLENAPFEPMQISRSERSKAYVKIQDGCNRHCSYCIIPSIRGCSRSRSIDAILDEVHTLVANGYSEIVLLGIEVTDFQPDIYTLLAELEQIDGLERIRLSSLYPSFLTHEFTDNIAKFTKIVPHFHLSLQSGSDTVLARMNRPYTSAEVEQNVAYLRKKIPHATFSADFIVAFPGETDDEFEATCHHTRNLALVDAHVFPYSIRPGTPAADMSNHVSDSKKKSRSATLIALIKSGQ